MRQSTPLLQLQTIAYMSVLVCSVRWSLTPPQGGHKTLAKATVKILLRSVLHKSELMCSAVLIHSKLVHYHLVQNYIITLMRIQSTASLLVHSTQICNNGHKSNAIFFHRIGPLGRFDLVVAKSVHMFACLSPSHAIFLRGGTGACVPRPRTGVRVRRPRVHLITRVEP